MPSQFTELVIDCRDATRQAAFWSAVLGYSPTGRYEGAVEIAGRSGPSLTFVPAPEAKQVKNRLHIDLSPRGCGQDEEVDRVIALGARQVDIGQGEQTWVVLADPEGNEFCVLRERLD